jgi:hypothetical protein
MHHNHESPRRRVLAAVVIAGMLVGGWPPPAEANPTVMVKVTILRITALDDFEGGGLEDFYACVTIAGIEECNEDLPSSTDWGDQEDVRPPGGWQFAREVDTSPGSTNVTIEIRDEDGFLRLNDDWVDVTSESGRNVDVTVSFVPCMISGEFQGPCAVPIATAGTSDEKALLIFVIEADALPTAPNLNLRCTHSPLWPQPGDTVTVTATALDGSFTPFDADTIELWIDNRTLPASTETAVTTSSTTAGPFPAGSFFYGCRIRHGINQVWSGWRVVQVGVPAGGRSVPILNTGPQDSRIDIVFVADANSYSGPTTSLFQSDVARMIDAYFSEPTFLKRQDHLNFWIALDMGAVQSPCPDSEPPDNWDDDYTFADTAALTHRNVIPRDCAPGGERFFTGDATRMDSGLLGRVFLHETGHRPFGLADEYTPDGGYFISEPFPNIYEAESVCEADIPALQVFDVLLGFSPRPAGSCRTLVTNDGTFWTSEPMTNHLMGADNLTTRGADLRQIEWLFAQCRIAGC